MPKAEASTLPAPVGRGAPGRKSIEPTADVRPQQAVESYPADRAFHAALARFSGGISPIALLLAYTDWLSHLAASPQRQLEISQDAVRDASGFLKLRGISSRPAGALVPDQAASAGSPLRPAGMGTSAVQSAGAGISADGAMVA